MNQIYLDKEIGEVESDGCIVMDIPEPLLSKGCINEDETNKWFAARTSEDRIVNPVALVLPLTTYCVLSQPGCEYMFTARKEGGQRSVHLQRRRLLRRSLSI
jgi:hypothetical protein